MDDFEDRARRAGDALNHSVIDLEPAGVAPTAPLSRRSAGVALVVVVALIAAGFAVSQRADHHDNVRADLPAPAAEPTPASPPRYLPRWLPDDMAPSKGTVGAGCESSSTVQSVPATTLSLPPGVHAASITGRIEPAFAIAVDSSGCPSAWWTAIFSGTASAGPRVVFLSGGLPPTPRSGAEAVTVHGRAASLSSMTSSSPATWLALSWSEVDIGLSMTGIGLTRDELLQVAENVERVSDDEWNDVIKASRSPTMPSTAVRPDLTTATELARLSTPDGQLVRLLATADGSSVCISSGNGFGCGSVAPPFSNPPRITTMWNTYGVISLPAGLPADVAVRRASGETLPSARSNDGRYLLIAGASLGTDYEIVDAAGQVLVTVKGFPCPQPVAGSTLCGAPTTTR
jgi:hypothetical protein